MAIDPSIFQSVQTPQPVNIPGPLDLAQKAMALSTASMQQMQMARQLRTQSAMQEALAKNTDADGNIDQHGAVSYLNQSGMSQAGMQLGSQFAQNDKAQAEAQAAKMDAVQKTLDITGPAFDYMAGMPEDQRAAAYPGVVQQLKNQGVDTSNMDHPYDLALFKQYYSNWVNNKTHLENMNTQAKTQEALANAGAPAPLKIGAEELGKFNEDVNNASSRKTTGSLIDARTRADRIMNILNSGAKPGETQDQRITRLNQYMPQIGTEIGTSLASIMQGGVPSEELNKKLAPDTMGSNLAMLEQKWKAEPTAANQGALLDAYGDVASKLRDFSAGQLQQITSRARAAYPFANKYFPQQMDKIGSQIGSQGAPAGKGAPTADAVTAAASSESKAVPLTAADDAKALQWLKKADPSSPKAFQIRAALKARGIL